jgi:hypothetical protein
MFDVPFLINNLHLVLSILLGSDVSILLTDHLGTNLYITLRIYFRPVQQRMLDKVYRRGVNIAAGIDDLEGVSIGLVII